jgi:hypothetical protein
VQALTIETTILVSTSILSHVIRLPETPAVYRSSAGRSMLFLRAFSWGARPNSAKYAETALRG